MAVGIEGDRTEIVWLQRGMGWPVSECAYCGGLKDCAFRGVADRGRGRHRLTGSHYCGSCVVRNTRKFVLYSPCDVVLSPRESDYVVNRQPYPGCPSWFFLYRLIVKENRSIRSIAEEFFVQRQRIQASLARAKEQGKLTSHQWAILKAITNARRGRNPDCIRAQGVYWISKHESVSASELVRRGEISGLQVKAADLTLADAFRQNSGLVERAWTKGEWVYRLKAAFPSGVEGGGEVAGNN